jgi:hypothetical protein
MIPQRCFFSTPNRRTTGIGRTAIMNSETVFNEDNVVKATAASIHVLSIVGVHSDRTGLREFSQ